LIQPKRPAQKSDEMIKRNNTNMLAYRFSVAPMMDWTDRHCRAFHRTLSSHARLYTEMVTAKAVLHGHRARLLRFDAAEHPVALQLGGADAGDLAEAARIGADFGYDEINLNVGCPSDRVQDGMFGACLMRHPQRVADCVAAMKADVAVPVTVKCRIGVDDQEPREALFTLAQAVVAAGADALIVHARKAWLDGLSPRENRSIPPLDYPLVHELARAMPDVPVILNGGLFDLAVAREHLSHVHGVMFGRAAYQSPALLLDVDEQMFGVASGARTTHDAVADYLPYVEARLGEGVPLAAMTRHMLGLFSGRPGARAWRRRLTVEACRPGAGLDVIERALADVSEPTRAPLAA
jgi:tRNA-dihydrouridine synthase A